MNRIANFVSTGLNWLIILILAAIMWEIAKNLWANWGTTSFWLSTLIAGIVGIAVWWSIGAILYLSAPRTVAQNQPSPSPSIQQSIGDVSGGSNVNQAGRDNISVVINNAAPQDTIPGTNVTNAKLRSMFPYGYIVFSLNRDGWWQYSPLPSDKMEYTADWKKVRIVPDFKEGTARWSIPELTSKNVSEAQVLELSIDDLEGHLNPTIVCQAGFRIGTNQPAVLVKTLSDDQRFPVFVLGFRILTEEESKHVCFKAPWTL